VTPIFFNEYGVPKHDTKLTEAEQKIAGIARGLATECLQQGGELWELQAIEAHLMGVVSCVIGGERICAAIRRRKKKEEKTDVLPQEWSDLHQLGNE
jgi:hypothetical protein